MQDLKKKISEVSERWIEAASKQDFSAVASCYTDDAAFFPPNAEPVIGREYIEVAFRDLMRKANEMARRTVEIEVHGGLAWETGTYVLSQVDGSAADQGKYMAIWKRIGNKWLIHRSIFNSSIPVPFMD